VTGAQSGHHPRYARRQAAPTPLYRRPARCPGTTRPL